MESTAKQLFQEALAANNPRQLITSAVERKGDIIDVNGKALPIKDKTVYCLAVGKASRLMASALKKTLSLPSSNILCITPEQHNLESYCVPSSHPIPDKKSKQAADKLISFIQNIQSGSVVFFLLSGGTSALVCKPRPHISPEDIGITTTLLLHSGAGIHEINHVRKHLSAIKGGQLLSYFPTDCTLIDLVISDVPSDNLANIGSGLTIPDSSTFQDAYSILTQYKLWDQTPEIIQSHIRMGCSGLIPETTKPGHDPLNSHHSSIIGSARLFIEKIADYARKKGLHTRIAGNVFNDNVKNVAKDIAGEIKRHKNKNCVLLFYGESTVKVTGPGKGGRNQELALCGALEIEGMNNVTWLSAGTDGIDGPTDAAGAIVNSSTITEAKEKGLDPKRFIVDNNSYQFHDQMETHLKTGATGNNMMDVVIVIIGKSTSKIMRSVV